VLYEEYFPKEATHIEWAHDFIPGPTEPDAWSQWVTLSAPVDLHGGSKYWVSIGAHLDVWYEGQFFLNYSEYTSEIRGARYSWSQGLWEGAEGDVAFSLYAVPEPTSFLLIGLGGLLVCRRR
jgi:hypothetical protein